MKYSLPQFSDFLKDVRLDIYRQKYVSIKIVEMDLPEEIQALKTIYEQYWENKGKIKQQLLAFVEFDPKNGVLQRYDNGFIVFTPKVFESFL